jgi:hypothetical protein
MSALTRTGTTVQVAAVATRTMVAGKANAPVYSFGTSEREKFVKTYYSKETAKLMTGRDTANATTLDSSYVEGRGYGCVCVRAGGWVGVGGGGHDLWSLNECFSPDHHRLPHSATLSVAHVFTACCPRYHCRLFCRQTSSLGKMVDSTKPSLPSWRIGTSPR